jgi:hypothetical protein
VLDPVMIDRAGSSWVTLPIKAFLAILGVSCLFPGSSGCSGKEVASSSVTDGSSSARDGSDDGSNAVSSGGGGCTPTDCKGPVPGAPNVVCSDGSFGGPVCAASSGGGCGWEIRACPVNDACPALGCFPSCSNGILKDSNVPVRSLMGPAERHFSQGHGTTSFADGRDHPHGRHEEFFAASWDQEFRRAMGPPMTGLRVTGQSTGK